MQPFPTRSHVAHEKQTEAQRQLREQSNSNSKLLRLPAEIREEIWRLTLPKDEAIVVGDACQHVRLDFSVTQEPAFVCEHFKGYSYPRNTALPTEVLQICRQIRCESTSLFFRSKIFVLSSQDYLTGSFDCVTHTEFWLHSISDLARAALRRVMLYEWDLGQRHFRVAILNLAERTARAGRAEYAGVQSLQQPPAADMVRDVEEAVASGVLDRLSADERSAEVLLATFSGFARKV